MTVDTATFTLVRLADTERQALRDALAGAGLPHADIAEAGRLFLAGRCGQRTVGHVGIEMHGEEALLRSLVVNDADRGQGFGRALVAGALDTAAAHGVVRAWTLTTTAADFLQHLGFRRVDRGTVPTAIAATREFASLCPATAACLMRELS